MLITFGGLPGTGKTTLARQIARECDAVYLRIDTIEQALRAPDMLSAEVGPGGYLVAYALAEENLRLGRSVVADSVNPLAITRDRWRAIAAAANTRVLEIEVICSDVAEHRRRVETRTVDIPGLVAPTWRQVTAHPYEPWNRSRLVLDTAGRTTEATLADVRAVIASR
jgi:predicted kinase